MKEITLPDDIKLKLIERLKPMVESGAIPNDDSHESRELCMKMQAVAANILKEELPNDILEEFNELKNSQSHLLLIKNMPTLDNYLPPTPKIYSEDEIGGYSNLILMGFGAIDGKTVPSIKNIVITDHEKQDDKTVAEQRKHRDGEHQTVNALYCLRGDKVPTNFFSFDDIVQHPDIKPHIDILTKPLFKICEKHGIQGRINYSETLGEPQPILHKTENGHYVGTEIYHYRDGLIREVRPANDEAKEAWDALHNLINTKDLLQPSASVTLDKGDVILFQEQMGLHSRGGFTISKELSENRWLKRADKLGKIETVIEDAETLLQYEQSLPNEISKLRKEKNLDASSISCKIP
jgi:hypothetical protein